jgi:hypothetical protein
MSVILRKFKVSAVLVIAGVVLVAASAAADAAITFERKLVPEIQYVQSVGHERVGISGNLVIASSYVGPGSGNDGVYVFDLQTGNQLHRLVPSSAYQGFMGRWADVSGTTVIGKVYPMLGAYLFDATTGQQTYKLTDTSFAVAIDGNRAVVTAPDTAVAWVFDTTTGLETATLIPDDLTSGDFFRDVNLSGNIAIVGGPNSGVYTFDITTGAQLAKFQPAQTISEPVVAISGSTALVGDYQKNEVYVFDAITGVQSATLLPEDSDPQFFGVAVAIDGNLALIGDLGDDADGSNAGAAYLFDVSTGVQLARIVAPDGVAGDLFGASVALEGNTAVIGAPGVNGNSGAVYAFTIPEPASLAVLMVCGAGLAGRRRR